MATFSSVSRHHVIQAIEEYDQRGGEAFCAVYGFTPQPQWLLHHDGRSYDLPAVVGVAHRFATGRLATSDDIAGSLPLAAGIMRKRGFDVRTVANDPKKVEVTGPGELRHGTNGTKGAELLSEHVGEFSITMDERERTSVDVVLGPDYRKLTNRSSLEDC